MRDFLLLALLQYFMEGLKAEAAEELIFYGVHQGYRRAFQYV